jgi:SNF2 family DNA or RNA helicase
MKAFGYVTNLHQGYNFANWAYKNGASANTYGAIVSDDVDRAIEGMKNIHNVLNNVYNCASRMTVDMFGSIFPDNQVNANCFDLGTVNTQKFNAITEQMESELAALDERSKTYKEHIFSVMMRWRRHSELLKVPSMVEWIEETYKEGSSAVVFINFQDTLDAIEKRLGNSYKHLIGKICGGQTDKQRNNDIELFQNDTKRIMLVNIQAGNSSVSLHDLNGNYPRRSLINPSWSAINTLQALGRIFRAEGKTKCIQNFMFALGTIEERMAERVQSKLNNIEALNDGDIQLEFNLMG